MAVLDLKPTTLETIEQLGISSHDLWLVQLEGVEYGPFETESLKHYAGENEELFENAQASRSDHFVWQPFFSHTQFQRRHPQLLKQASKQEGPYWLLDHGQKTGPFTPSEIDKKIELGSIGFTDLISHDDGDTWYKLYQVSGFDRRFHCSSELPFAPTESEFQKARLELLEKVEEHASTIKPSEELAEMAHQAQISGKVIAFRPEDIPIRRPSDISVSSSLKWKLPLAIAAMVAVVIGMRIIGTHRPEDGHDQLAENQVHESSAGTALSQAADPSSTMPNKTRRAPASSNPPTHNQGSVPNFTPPIYNTSIETHHNDYPPENDHYQESRPDENREPASEQTLVPGDQPTMADEQNTDAAMGNPAPPVEEVSDF